MKDSRIRPSTNQHQNQGARMRIGIVGAGNIGKTLSHKLSAAGHDVKIANSRSPQTIDPEALSTGARAVEAADAVRDVEVVILSIPLNRMPAFASTVRGTARRRRRRHLELLPDARWADRSPRRRRN
ncbi:NAD(P)-binding domain-containing protein [Mycolicibacterium sediminis]|nr:NAD(P)-binding domain-containing protein [Mycolicibacterium sediminis]